MAKRGRGRPPKEYRLENGVVSADEIFLYCPRDTIPQNQINRYLKLCDEQLKEMNLEELTTADVDELAQYNRSRMLKDYVIKIMVNPVVPSGVVTDNLAQFTDLGLITQTEKLHKQMNSHLENLKFRRKDRHTGKMGGQHKSISDLAREFDEEPRRVESLKKKSEKDMKSYEEEYEDSDPLKFIENMSRPTLDKD